MITNPRILLILTTCSETLPYLLIGIHVGIVIRIVWGACHRPRMDPTRSAPTVAGAVCLVTVRV